MVSLTYITGNANKAREASAILGIEVIPHKLDVPEIQSWDLETIVRAKAEAAQKMIGSAVLVDDVSFDMVAMNGFPGPFVRFWEDQVGYDLAVQIAKSIGDDRVTIRNGIGYADGDRFIYTEGQIQGRIIERSDGEGFGFDFYFLPDGQTETFAQIGSDLKNKISHRALALTAMREKLADSL